MITEDKIKKYASTVLLNTIYELFDNESRLIDNFFKEFIEDNKKNRKLQKNYKDNEILDELLLEQLEKSFTQNDIGATLNKQMIKEQENAISELAYILDEKLYPIESDLKRIFNDDAKYDEFRKLTTENLVVSNMNLNSSAINAMKTLKMEGIQVAQIMQLITTLN
ncbi:MAG: hypothetical protein BZ136_00035 [Methanosphaera sp. rholeuAM74]|nr:MAG: hypothetical protein BZ136_00035 [Methanosphaera sp. rholeuAM74]